MGALPGGKTSGAKITLKLLFSGAGLRICHSFSGLFDVQETTYQIPQKPPKRHSQRSKMHL